MQWQMMITLALREELDVFMDLGKQRNQQVVEKRWESRSRSTIEPESWAASSGGRTRIEVEVVKKRKEKRIKVHLKIADPDRHGELASRKILAGQVWKQAFFPWGGRGRCPGVRPPAGWVGDRWDRGEVAEDLLTAAGEADDDKKSYWESSTGRTSLSRAGGTLHIKYEGALLCLWNRECNLGNLLWAIAQALGVGPEDYEVVSGLSVKSDVPRRWIRHSLAVPLDWDPST